MRLLALLGVVFAVLMGLRSLTAALGLVDSSVSSTLVNSASVLAAGMSLIGAVVGLVDLDHFKLVNDTHGHALGDQVIRHLARLLQGCESPTCRAARLGGEEFVIVALGPDQAAALLQTLEQLRAQFQQGGPLPAPP